MRRSTQNKSELRLSASQNDAGFLKAVLLNVRGPAGIIILALWMSAVVLVSIFAQGVGRATAFGLLAFFIAAYFTALRRK